MKKLFIIFFIFASFTTFSQSLNPVKYGVKTGLNILTSHLIDDTENDGSKTPNINSKAGLNFGFYLEIPMAPKWYLNTDLIYSQEGISFNYMYKHEDSLFIPYSGKEYDTKNVLDLNYIKIIPNFTYKFNDKVNLGFGPSISYLLNSSLSYSEDPLNELINDPLFDEESIIFGANFSIAYYTSEKLLISINSISNFMSAGSIDDLSGNIDNTLSQSNSSFKIKNNTLTFSIAYLL